MTPVASVRSLNKPSIPPQSSQSSAVTNEEPQRQSRRHHLAKRTRSFHVGPKILFQCRRGYYSLRNSRIMCASLTLALKGNFLDFADRFESEDWNSSVVTVPYPPSNGL